MTPRAFRGSTTLLVLVFGGIFLLVLSALSGHVLVQNRAEDVTRIKAEAFNVAEAGLEYYRWHLAHFPSDLTNGTGLPGPYAIAIPDPSGGAIGTASLAITPNTSCNQTTSIDIASTGTASDGPSFSQTVIGRYAQTSVASYSYIVNDSVWAGSDRIINGPYHSNGGVRMDGTTNAPVTSSVSSWTCTSSFGCSPNATEPGVFGGGSNQNLWRYPTPQLDFAGIAADFTSLKATAQSRGIYLQRYSSGASNSSAYHKGYHLVFNSNNTVTVYRVSSATRLTVTPVNSSDPTTDYALIGNQTSYNTYTIPSNCGLIFVEDNTWVEGIIPSKVTLVVANVTTTGVTPDAFLKGSITYASADGSGGFTLISSHDILITPNSPQNMTLNGVFIAQSGAFGRNYYGNAGWGCDGTYEPRGTLTILGSTISNKRTGTQWKSGCSPGNAGYLSRIDSFDRMLANDPPPFTPVISTDYSFVDWQQK
ncbi:hypothetical protein HY972_01015 [Candidatus Kaiserbacteria bacterium]|nr:hypothetical protein [Candidatus Kaiserbacteria bacterium]